MYLDRISAAAPETCLITRDTLALNQWEALVADAELANDTLAWPSRPFASWPGWLAACWENAKASGLVDRDRLLLSPIQTERLWQRVVDESEHGPALISSSGVSRWARSARRSLLDCGLVPNQQSGPLWQDDAAAFLGWNRSFEAYLNRNGWVDSDALLREINKLPPAAVGQDLILLDPPTTSPEGAQLFARWRAEGRSVESIEPDGYEANLSALIAADPWDELERSADWALREIQQDSKVRLALVVPDLESRREEVESVFAEKLGSDFFMLASNRAIGDISIFGAALTAIELLSGRADFNALSRWLRSPFFVSDDPERERHTTALEIALRSEPRTQQSFADAWRHRGLKASFKGLPDTSSRLELAFDRLPQRATPTTWTAIWQRCLQTLGWQGFELGLSDSLRNGWENAWAAFSELTPIVGLQDMDSALETFSRIVATQSIYEPMPLAGVHLMNRMTQIGPGYAGAWICGFSDEILSESGNPNPLLPWSVQVAHGMPGASPEADLEASHAELKRLKQRVPRAHFSCPGRIRDQPQLPSPLVSGWKQAPSSMPPVKRSDAHTIQRIGARTWQQADDRAPPLTGNTIPGGTRTLDLQANCPVKAFCISRLRAEPLDTPSRGIDPRLRGILMHRVLELLLDPNAPDASFGRIDRSIETAFTELVHPGDACWDTQIRAERGRIEGLLDKFLALEANRPAFTTIAVERKADIVIDELRLRCRIDRVDSLNFVDMENKVDQQLSSGQLLIDYKTGQSAGGRWFGTRLSDCQLPIYAQQAADVGGIMTIRLSGSEIEYRGAGRKNLALPAKLQAFDETDWIAQLARWRAQITELLQEFAAGDVRIRANAGQHIRSSASEHSGGAFAPLTRVGELK